MKKLLNKFLALISRTRKQTVQFARKKTAKETATEIALLIEQKFKNWVTADEVFDKFKKEFGTVEHTFNILQTCVYYKVALVKQLPDQRPRFKVVSSKVARDYVLDEIISEYKQLITNLENERKQYGNEKESSKKSN